MTPIYLDNNATTRVDPRVLSTMIEELERSPANPSSVHTLGRSAKKRLTEARQEIADTLSVSPHELTFTSGGTEALHLAILGLKAKGPILTSSFEHSAVYRLLEQLEIDGREIITVHPKDLAASITPNLSLIVCTAANSETGIRPPIDEIAQAAQSYSIPLIVDGVALLGKEPFTLHPGITAMAFSSHKLHGPQGVGLLFSRKELPLRPLLYGGGQERLLRSGTENLPGIIGFARAVSLLQEELPAATDHMRLLRDHFENTLSSKLNIKINGRDLPRLPNTSNITFHGADGEALLIQLDLSGVCASLGSACASGALEPSRTLLAMGHSREEARASLRFSLSRLTTKDEIDRAIELIVGACSY